MSFENVYSSGNFTNTLLNEFSPVCRIPESLIRIQKYNSENIKKSVNKRVPASLDTNIKFVCGDGQILRLELEKMRRYSGSILVDEKDKERGYSTVCTCGVKRLNSDIDKSPVNLVRGAETGKYFYNGLMKCGSVWRCPVCSFKISQHRQNEIYYMSSEWLRQGGKISFITLTLRHKIKDKLNDSLDLLTSEFRKLQGTKAYKGIEKKYNIKGFVKTLEITFGMSNGWHPHLHLLVFHETENFKNFHSEFIKIWCKRKNVKALERSQMAINVYDGAGVSEYVTKWDMTKEMTRSNFKDTKTDEQRYTPFSILRRLANKDKEFTENEQGIFDTLHYLFLEYCKATKGKHFISVSKKMKQYFKELSGEEMKSDTEILSDEKFDKIELRIDINLWDYVVKRYMPSYLLNAFENGGVSYVLSLFNEIGVVVCYEESQKLLYPLYDYAGFSPSPS